jgi:hypothetical protein
MELVIRVKVRVPEAFAVELYKPTSGSVTTVEATSRRRAVTRAVSDEVDNVTLPPRAAELVTSVMTSVTPVDAGTVCGTVRSTMFEPGRIVGRVTPIGLPFPIAIVKLARNENLVVVGATMATVPELAASAPDALVEKRTV